MFELKHESTDPITVARQLAPEDVCAGDYVALLHVVGEYPSFLWGGDASILPADESVKIHWTGWGNNAPVQIQSVCLPFVLVKDHRGNSVTWDVRCCSMARLNKEFGEQCWDAFKSRKKKKPPHQNLWVKSGSGRAPRL